MWGVLATAIVALAGITATFFAPSWSDQVIERRREASSFRVARRLVSQELRRLAFDLDAIAGQNITFDPKLGRLIEITVWEQQQEALARSLNEATWTQVCRFYTGVEKIRVALALQQGQPVDAERRAALQQMGQLARDAERSLN
jgi:hypothetical protein